MTRKASIFLITALVWSVIYSVSLANDVAIIVNKENTLDALSMRELTNIFRLEKRYWENRDLIYFIMQESDNSATKIVISKVLSMHDYHELRTYWLQLIFREELSSFPQVLSSDEATRRFISQAPTSIGFIDAKFIDDRVKVLRIDGKLPGDKGYPLTNSP